jgi:hypothetical protein
LTNEITEKIEITMRSHPGPNQVYVFEFGSNNMRKTTKPALEVAKVVSRFRRTMTEAEKATVRVLLCGTIPDPRPAVDSKLKLLDEALKDLEMGEGNKFLSLRGSMLDANGHVRTDIFKPRGDIHLNASGTQIASHRIQRMLEIMIPALAQAPAPVQTPPAPVHALVQAPAVAKRQRVRILAPVQDEDPAPVFVNETPVVDATLVAAVVNDPAVVNQGQVETPMEVEDEDTLLQRLFFKRFGRALPEEKEKEKEKDEVDQINMNLIDLTKDDTEEMEDDTTPLLIPNQIVKTEPIEIANVVNVVNVVNVNKDSKVAANQRRASRRLEIIQLAKARKAITEFGKSLQKKEVIPEKEAPLAASSNVIADNDTDMAEDVSVNAVESVNTVETAERALAETDAAIAANREEFAAEFGDTPVDEFDVDIEPLC